MSEAKGMVKTMRKRILTGDRPTGNLHLGHYVGSLKSRVSLQDEYETFILLADIQALTTHFEKPELINENILQVAIDNLSAGVDPEKVLFIQQSQIRAIAELTVMFSMFVPVNRLADNPTIKTEAKNYRYKSLNYGFLGYPVSQTADILFCAADLVPVGEDQLPHMEETGRIVKRFNQLYGDVFKKPEAMISDCARLIGLDGSSKMGKSLGNAIYLCDTKEIVYNKIKAAVTDTSRIHKSDHGHPDICTVYRYHTIFNDGEANNIKELCRNGCIGCAACKENLSQSINEMLEPMRERRAKYINNKDMVREMILEGSRKANIIGDAQIEKVKSVMHLKL
ncbi:MAG: tryptophan--tRNA ligase [Peptostreptococcaceae bacterium]|nr:tryptophan--tRNA ligase [Peptostreptococcaceae bacterium]